MILHQVQVRTFSKCWVIIYIGAWFRKYPEGFITLPVTIRPLSEKCFQFGESNGDVGGPFWMLNQEQTGRSNISRLAWRCVRNGPEGSLFGRKKEHVDATACIISPTDINLIPFIQSERHDSIWCRKSKITSQKKLDFPVNSVYTLWECSCDDSNVILRTVSDSWKCCC